ncbi:hypothetical protein [Comamonas sp.]|uniref:hypothetical protein n=1 Tax=Comamonas sp. TaxID=34028 RepID=UPI0028A938C8|nr:hypothetical protein [Comamonas sp.]
MQRIHAAAHCRAGQQPHDCSLVNAFVQRFAQSIVLQDLLGNGLRQFFEHTLGHGAFQGAAHQGLGHSGLCAGSHNRGIQIGDAQGLGHLAAQQAKCAGGRSAQRRDARLPGGHHAGVCALADLLSGRARSRDALTGRCSAHRTDTRRERGNTTAYHATGQHRGDRLPNGVGDGGQVLQRGHELAADPICVGHGLVGLLLGGAVAVIQDGIGILEAQADIL